jgi:dTDP-4-amino-4,6-dideoxygalactose transaminase
VGINSRLDNLQASILGVKLPHLDTWNRQRLKLAQQYDAYFAAQDLGIRPLKNESGEGHVYHLYVVELEAGWDRAALQQQLSDHHIYTGIHYPIPCHLQPAFVSLGYQAGDFPQAEILCERILSLPLYPGLEQAQVTKVCETLAQFKP